MGKADQLAKRIFEEETERVTGRRVRFEVPPEVPVGALGPDGVVCVAEATADVTGLSAPWCRLRREATLEAKMRGDHMDRAATARAELRRHARWVRHLEALRERSTAEPADPDRGDALEAAAADDFALWVLAPHVPRWLRRAAARGMVTLELVAPGCWKVGPRDYEFLWVAANELPLRVELVPLLLARTGKALGAFLRWAAGVMGAPWVVRVVQELPMDPELAEEFRPIPEDEESQHRIKLDMLRTVVPLYPELVEELERGAIERGIKRGIERGMLPVFRLFERKLSRTPTEREHGEIVRRLSVLGADRLADVVLDLDGAQLAAWLADPDAH